MYGQVESHHPKCQFVYESVQNSFALFSWAVEFGCDVLPVLFGGISVHFFDYFKLFFNLFLHRAWVKSP